MLSEDYTAMILPSLKDTLNVIPICYTNSKIRLGARMLSSSALPAELRSEAIIPITIMAEFLQVR